MAGIGASLSDVPRWADPLNLFRLPARIGKKHPELDPLGLFQEPPEPPPPPKAPEPPPVMPTPDDEAVRRSKSRSVARQRARGGRVSTIFTSGLGG